MWDSSWWRDISVLEGISILIPRLIHICTICKRYIILVCYIYMYVHIFPHRNHSANLPWTKIPPFPPAPAKRKRCEYIYILYTHIILIYLHTLNLINLITFQMDFHGRCLCGSLRCWTYSSHGVGRPPAPGLIRGSTWRQIFVGNVDASLVCFFKTESWSRWWNLCKTSAESRTSSLCCDCWLDMVFLMGESALWLHGKWMTWSTTSWDIDRRTVSIPKIYVYRLPHLRSLLVECHIRP